MPVEDGRANLRTRAIGKLEVEHHDVGPLFGRGGDRVRAVGYLGDDEPVMIRQLGPDSLSHEPLILDDQNARRHLRGMVVRLFALADEAAELGRRVSTRSGGVEPVRRGLFPSGLLGDR